MSSTVHLDTCATSFNNRRLLLLANLFIFIWLEKILTESFMIVHCFNDGITNFNQKGFD